jgi:predicted HicB family RNase H-like nuclease
MMNVSQLSYLGYQGSAEVSLEDDCLCGKLLFISDLVTYEAQTVPGLRKAFEQAVEFYLEKCAEMG